MLIVKLLDLGHGYQRRWTIEKNGIPAGFAGSGTRTLLFQEMAKKDIQVQFENADPADLTRYLEIHWFLDTWVFGSSSYFTRGINMLKRLQVSLATLRSPSESLEGLPNHVYLDTQDEDHEGEAIRLGVSITIVEVILLTGLILLKLYSIF